MIGSVKRMLILRLGLISLFIVIIGRVIMLMLVRKMIIVV